MGTHRSPGRADVVAATDEASRLADVLDQQAQGHASEPGAADPPTQPSFPRPRSA